jgi:hypothetical protein
MTALEQLTAMSQGIREIEAQVRRETVTLQQLTALLAKTGQTHQTDAYYEEARQRYLASVKGGAT